MSRNLRKFEKKIPSGILTNRMYHRSSFKSSNAIYSQEKYLGGRLLRPPPFMCTFEMESPGIKGLLYNQRVAHKEM